MNKTILLLFLSVLTAVILIACVRREKPARRPATSSTGYNGIDVSRHNRKIDWKKVAQDKNIQFVYIKATEGSTYKDPTYDYNVREARRNGLKIGSYHYFRMTSSPAEQLRNVRKVIDKKCQDLIPMVDVETTDGYPIAEVRRRLRTFLQLLEKHYGRKPLIYSSNRLYNQICGNSFNNHTLYLGRYGNTPPVIQGREHYTVWQYSERGRINGIPNPTDLCRFHPDNGLEDILLKK